VRRLSEFIAASSNPGALVAAIEAIAGGQDHGYPELEYADPAHEYTEPKMVLVREANVTIVYETLGIAPLWVLGLVAIVPIRTA
jgi:hypothetical protein